MPSARQAGCPQLLWVLQQEARAPQPCTVPTASPTQQHPPDCDEVQQPVCPNLLDATMGDSAHIGKVELLVPAEVIQVSLVVRQWGAGDRQGWPSLVQSRAHRWVPVNNKAPPGQEYVQPHPWGRGSTGQRTPISTTLALLQRRLSGVLGLGGQVHTLAALEAPGLPGKARPQPPSTGLPLERKPHTQTQRGANMGEPRGRKENKEIPQSINWLNRESKEQEPDPKIKEQVERKTV